MRPRPVCTALLLAAAAGCVHSPALTGAQHCALDGMLLAGTSYGTGGASAIGIGANGSYQGTTVASSYGASFSCRRAETPREKCEVRAAAIGAEVKQSYHTSLRNAALFVGWIVFVLPGAVMYLAFDNQSDSTAREASYAENSARMYCPGDD